MSGSTHGDAGGGPPMTGAALGALLGAAVGTAIWWAVSRLRGAAGSEPLRGSDPVTRS